MRLEHRQGNRQMSLVVTCQCGRQFMASADLAGKRVPCPACGGTISVPLQETAASSVDVSDPPIVVACVCGGRFQAPPHLLGKRLPCPTCGQPIHVVRPTAEAHPVPAAFDDSALAATAAAPVSPPPRARGGAWAQPHRREEPVNMRPVIIASSIGGGAVVLLILAMIVTSIVSSCRDEGAKETENSPAPPSVLQPSAVTPIGQAGNAASPVLAPKPDTAGRPADPPPVRPDDGPAPTVKPPETPPPADHEPAARKNGNTTAQAAPALLIGGLPLPLARAFAKEMEAVAREVWAEQMEAAERKEIRTEAELKALGKSVGRGKAGALLIKYGVDGAQSSEIMMYALNNGWIDRTGPFADPIARIRSVPPGARPQ
jgi:hypothetical protein